MKQAACKDSAEIEQTYDRFFGDGVEHTFQASRVCAICPVQPQCLDQAIANREKYGVWGGKSWRQRDTERRRRNATKAAFETPILPVIEEVAAAMACTPDSMSRFLRELEAGGGRYEGSMLRLQGVRS